MTEIILFTILLVALLALLVFYRWWEGRYVRRKTREALSPTLREEIEEERRQALERKRKFEETLRQVQGASHTASKGAEIQLKKP